MPASAESIPTEASAPVLPVMHYLIWHHDGRRWRMGASMMGPNWTHWNGAVDAIMNKLGTMINDIETRRKLKAIDDKLKLLSDPAGQ